MIRAFLIPVGYDPITEVTVNTGWPDLAKAIGCRYIEKQSVCGSPTPLPLLTSPSLLVDEEASFKPVRINVRASHLFGYRYHGQSLRGAALLVWTSSLDHNYMSAPEGIDINWVHGLIENRRKR